MSSLDEQLVADGGAPLGEFLYSTLQQLMDDEPGLTELGLLVTVPAPPASSTDSSSSSLIVAPPLPPALLCSASSSIGAASPAGCCPPFLIHRGEHALGIAFWAVPHLYRYATAVFTRARSLSRVGLPSSCSAPPSSSLCPPLLRSTRALLVINADNNSAWNARKRCLLLLFPDKSLRPPAAGSSPSPPSSSPPSVPECAAAASLLAELSFVSLVMSKHPKSSEAWSHRRWLLRRLLRLRRRTLLTTSRRRLLRGELDAAARAAQAHPKNYLAWCYRAFALSLIGQPEQERDAEDPSSAGGQQEEEEEEEEQRSAAEDAALLQEEMSAISSWTDSHVSDHSGFHYRSLVVSRLLLSASAPSPSLTAPLSLLLSELSSLSQLQSLYPGHESCWAYRRFLLFRLVLVDWADARTAEQSFCRQRAAAAGQGGDEDRKEALYSALHGLYVLELLAGQRWHRGNGQQKVEEEQAERAHCISATERLLAVSDRPPWRERTKLLLRLQADAAAAATRLTAL